MQRYALTLLALLTPFQASAQALEPSYSRGGFDYFSAPVEPAQRRAVPTQCALQFGKNTEVAKVDSAYRCSVTTLSEPRLSTRLNEEIALADQFDEPRRQKVVNTLIEKYQRLAQCPAGTEAFHDGSMYWCVKTFAAKALCPSGAPAVLESGEIGCLISSCAKGFTELGPPPAASTRAASSAPGVASIRRRRRRSTARSRACRPTSPTCSAKHPLPPAVDCGAPLVRRCSRVGAPALASAGSWIAMQSR